MLFLLKVIPHVDGTPRICELVRYYMLAGPCHRRLTARPAIEMLCLIVLTEGAWT